MSYPCNPPIIITGNCDGCFLSSCGTCGCNTCSCGGSRCSSVCGCTVPGTSCPEPYYSQDPFCQEDHARNQYIVSLYTTLKVTASWNIPACGTTAVINFASLKSLVVGSNLWNPTYGYFEVTAVDLDTGNVTVKNNCVDGNAAVGTQVPACADFVVTPPPCCTGGGGQNPGLNPYVAIDFTAPAVSTCLDITVTSVNGLSVGHLVQIGSGTYRVSGISSATVINICNDGAGITPGTSVIAKNAGGDYQYPIILIDSNVCNNTAVTSGAILVCKAGIEQPLSGLSDGMVPILTDSTTNTVEFRYLGVPISTCTALTVQLTLSTGQVSYTLTVDDSTVFVVGDVLQLGTRSDRLTITSLPDSTHIVGDMDPVPGSIQLVPIGTTVCTVGCCEHIQDELDAQVVQVPSNTSTNKTGTILIGAGPTVPTLTSNNAILTLDNSAGVVPHSLRSLVTFEVHILGVAGPVNQMAVNTELFIDVNGGGFVSAALDRRDWNLPIDGLDLVSPGGIGLVTTAIFDTAGTASDVITAKATISLHGGETASFDVTTFKVKIDSIGVRL